jgi:putative SOS response-associated peptidase YedK
MCYHKQSKATAGELEKYYEAVMRYVDYQPNYYENAFDFNTDPVLTADRPKELLPYAWGFIPWWCKTLEEGQRLRLQTLNCISEEMFTKSSFRDSANEGKRCLIPATGFFEWHWDNPAKAKNKTPFVIKAKDQDIFSIAGLYSTWLNKQTNEEVLTYTVLTTVSNAAMSYVHNSKRRQPVIIKKEFEKDWLNPNLPEADILELCKSMPEDFLTYYSIGKGISGNKLTTAEKNNPDIEKPVEYPAGEVDAATEASGKNKKSGAGQQSLF